MSKSITKGRVFCIGDVHGCLDELNDLIKMMRLTSHDRIVFAGDLVDKGPDSAGVVKRVRELAKAYNVQVCFGNHEEMHVRWMNKPADRKTEMKRHAEFEEIHKGMSDADREFLSSTRLYVSVPGGIVTHAGVPEFLKSLPPDVPFKDLPKKTKDMAKQMCRLRYIDDQGNFVGLYETDPDVHTFWAEVYDGRFGHVYFGHQPYMEDKAKDFENATGLDLGCVFGGYLLAVELAEDGTRVAQLSVRGKEYAPLHGGE